MKAFATSSGGVFFVPEKIEGASQPISYNELLADHEKPGSMNKEQPQKLTKAARS